MKGQSEKPMWADRPQPIGDAAAADPN